MGDLVGSLNKFVKDTDPLKDGIDDMFSIKDPGNVTAPTPPAPPENDPESIAARDSLVAEERRKRVAAGKVGTNPTGGLGLTSPSGAVAKQLLGA